MDVLMLGFGESSGKASGHRGWFVLVYAECVCGGRYPELFHLKLQVSL